MTKHYLASLFTVLFIVLVSASCAAQKNTTSNTVVITNKTIYAKAVEYGDFNTAIVAAHNILANSPADYHFMDSLARLYYASGNLVAAINIGNDILNAAPQNITVREIVANSQLGLGLSGEALINYNDLFGRTSNLLYLYNVASTEFGMKRFTEAGLTLDKILKADGNLTKVSLTGTDGRIQEIPLKAAALNIKGAIAVEVNNIPIAKQNFEEALKIAPDFDLAKTNLAQLNKK